MTFWSVLFFFFSSAISVSSSLIARWGQAAKSFVLEKAQRGAPDWNPMRPIFLIAFYSFLGMKLFPAIEGWIIRANN